MRVHFEMLRQPDEVLAALRSDGWELESAEGGGVCARHPRVPDEEAARSRLTDLGLLTSSQLRINFLRTAAGLEG
jgi:hypothetical protein